MKISRELLNIDNDRKIDLINKSHIIKEDTELFYSRYNVTRYQVSIFAKIDKAFTLYHKYYRDDSLNEFEKAFFAIYIVFCDDEKFSTLCKNYKFDFKRISSLYGLSEICAYLRYKNMMMMRKFEKDDDGYQFVLKKNTNK